ncbi:MAG: hypothetical protein ACT4QF_04055 [Sporichthyaceae bacterium]
MRISGAVPALCLLGALVGCGGQDASAPPPAPAASQSPGPTAGAAAAIVRQAVERMAAESHRYRLEITEADGPITGEGEYAAGPPMRIRETFSFADAEFGTQTFERIAVGAGQWFRAALGGTGAGPEQEKWLNAPAFGGGENETLGPFDVRTQVALLPGAADLSQGAAETIDGIQTVRYRATAVGSAEPSALEVWIDPDGRIRRLVQTSAGSAGISLAQVNFRDWGAAVEVAPPPADQIATPGQSAAPSPP